MASQSLVVSVGGVFDDAELNILQASADGCAAGTAFWTARTARHSLTWITAWS